MSRRFFGLGGFIAIFYLAVYLIVPIFVHGESAGSTGAAANLIFSEIKVRNDSAGLDEFIELYNTSTNQLALSDFSIEYFNSTNPAADQTPTTKAVIDTNMLGPNNYFVLAKNSGQIPNSKTSPFSSLQDSGGRLKLKNAAGDVIDEVAWTSSGTPISPIVLVPSSASNKSITRATDSSGKPIVGGVLALATPSPHSDELTTPPPPEPDEPPNYLPVQITELLIDPLSPQTDANDEFIELYNPNTDPIDLKDYVIKTGSSFQYHYAIADVTLASGEYMVWYAKDTGLVLSNSGGQAQVFDPLGNPASDLIKYDASEAGQSWADIDGVWHWTASLTPGAVNVFALPGSDSSDNTAPAGPFPPLIINELLINPASPQKDADDEFIEIYNPNSVPVNTEGYQVLSGSSLKTKFTLPADTIGPGGYKVYYSSTANVSLSNSGGEVRLVDPANTVVYETQEYTEADDGDAWARFDGGWNWTGTPTPGSANVLTMSSQSVKAAKAKASTAKKASAAKAKAAAKAKKDKSESITAPATIPVSPLTTGLVATAAGLALLYGIYEFRYDIRNRLQLVKQYFEGRWHSGP